MAARELSDAEVFGAELSDADVFGAAPAAAGGESTGSPFRVGRGSAYRPPRRPESVLVENNPEPGRALPNPLQALTLPTGDATQDAINLLFDSRTPVQAVVNRNAVANIRRRQQQQQEAIERESADAAFGGPVTQALAAPGRRLAAGAAQLVGGVASLPQQFGFDLGRDTAEAASAMAKANMPAEPGIADEVLVGAGQVGPMVIGGTALNAILRPVIGARSAASVASAGMGAAGAGMSGQQVLQDLEGRIEIPSDEKRLRALGATVFSALTGAYADRMLLPGLEAAVAGRPLAAGARAFGTEAGQEGADQLFQNFATDKPLGEGVGRASLVGGVVGGGARAVGETQTAPFQLANAIDADARAFADAPLPQVTQQPATPIVQPAAARAPSRPLTDVEVGLDAAAAPALQREEVEPTPGQAVVDAPATPARATAPATAPQVQQQQQPQPEPEEPAFNPTPEPGVVDAVGQHLEQLYQDEVKDSIRQRLGLEAPVEEQRAPRGTEFINFLRHNGVKSDLATEIYGENAFRANRALPGVFRKNGLPLDELVLRAVESGFLTQADVESALDNGGTRKLTELIQAQIRGEAPVSNFMAGDVAGQQQTDRATDELQRQARDIGFDTGGMTEPQIAAALARIERRRAESAGRRARFEAAEEARREREAIQQDGALTPEDVAALDGDWLEGNNVTLAEGMRALGFTEQEIEDAVAAEAAQAGRAQAGPGAAAGATPRAASADQGREGGQREDGDEQGRAVAREVEARETDPLFPETDRVDYGDGKDNLPAAAGSQRAPARPDSGAVRRHVQPARAVPAQPEVEGGDYYLEAFIASNRSQELGAPRIVTPAQAAQATQYLYRSAVERFDAVVTDDAGKPLAVIGGFKGAVAETAVYPTTLLFEAISIPGAKNLWLSHNHPSGNHNLSPADIRLSGQVAETFKGTGIDVRGILAIGRGTFTFRGTKGEHDTGDVPDAQTGTNVPVYEREQVDERVAPISISSPDVAKVQAKAFYARAKQPGLLLLDSQNNVAGWLPVTPSLRGKLQDTGALAALYRAIAKSSIRSVIVAHAGELDAQIRPGLPIYENIASALKRADITTLDVVDVAAGTSSVDRGVQHGHLPLYSRPRGSEASSAASVREELAGRFGDIIDRLEKRGFLKVWDSVEQYNQQAGRASQIRGAAQGTYHNGVAHLFASDIEPGNAVGVFLHEVGEHASMEQMLGPQRYADLVNRAHALVAADDDIANTAMLRVPDDTAPEFKDSELLAYLIEEASARKDASPALRKWLADALAAIRAWFYQTGFSKRLEKYGVRLDLTPADIVALAERAVRWQAEQGGQQRGPVGRLAPQFARAFHGTPHEVDRFTTAKMGTGEGHQAFGWGLYFAESKAVADHYREALSTTTYFADGRRLSGDEAWAAQFLAGEVPGRSRTPEQAKAEVRETLSQSAPEGRRKSAELEALIDALAGAKITEATGSLYEADIPDAVVARMLLWDKPLRDQPQAVRDAAARMDRSKLDADTQAILSQYGDRMQGSAFYQLLAADDNLGGKEGASKLLESLGVPGIKFLDGDSRNRPLREIKREFLAELPEDANFDEVQDLIGTGAFSPQNETILKALAADDWLGFDYPAQALSAALSPQLQNSDASPALMQAVEAAQSGGTHNLVVFNDNDVTITHKDGSPVTAPEREEVVRLSRPASKSVEANVRRGREAMNRALLEKADQHRAMFRTGMGWVDFVWGDDKKGLQHVFRQRAEKDGMSEADTGRMLVDDIVDAIARGTEVRRRDIAGTDGQVLSTRVALEHNGYEAILVKNRGSNAWVLSGWEKKASPGTPKAGNDASGASQRIADSTDDTQGAGDGSIVPGQGASGMRFSRPPGPAPALSAAAQPSWTVPEPGTWDNFVRAIQNNKIDLKRVRDAIEQQFGRIADDKDAYLAEELYHGKVAARVEKLHRDSVEPILRKIAVAGKNAGVTLDDVNTYLHARHAPERNAAMKAINPNMPNNDALSGMSDADAAQKLADFRTAGKEPALAAIAKDIDQLLADTRTALVADGLEEIGTIQQWEQAYKHYVPLMRDIEDRPAPRGQGISVRGPESKRAVGSNRQVVNILANIVTQAETAAIRAEKSEVGRTLLAMAQQYPNPDFWKVDTPPVKPRIDPNTGLVQRSAIDPAFQTADNVVMVKDYGAVRFIVFNKDNARARAAGAAMKNLDFDQMPKVIEWAGKATRFMASLLTQRNPEFWLTNFARDLQAAGIQMSGTEAEGLQGKAARNLPKALAGMRDLVRGTGSGQWARHAQDLKEAGGTTGYMQMFENSDARMKNLQREVDRMNQGRADPRKLVRQLVDFIDDYNDVIENGVRLAVFQAARDAGVSTARAASVAKNVTINFNRKGNTTPLVNSLYMFFNAGVQGNARLAQALATSRTAQAAVGLMAAAGFVLDAVNRAMAGDDDETKRNRYDLIPEFEKTRNWIFMNPMRPGEYVKVPLPIGFHIFHNAGRLVSDGIFRRDARNASEYGWAFASAVLDAFNPLGQFASVGQAIAPSVLDPVVQLAENKSFIGAPVYRSAEQGFGKVDPKPAFTRYFENTPDVWRHASRMLNSATGGDKVKPGVIDIEPDILRHVYGALTGGPGRAVDRTIDAAQASARGTEVSPSRIPLVNRFYGGNDDRQRDAAYYSDLKRAERAKSQFDYFTKNGRRDLAVEVLKEAGRGDIAKGRQLISEYERARKDDRVINRELRQLAEKRLDGQDVQDQITETKQRREKGRFRALAETAEE